LIVSIEHRYKELGDNKQTAYKYSTESMLKYSQKCKTTTTMAMFDCKTTDVVEWVVVSAFGSKVLREFKQILDL